MHRLQRAQADPGLRGELADYAYLENTSLQASYLALPTADRARIEEFVGAPSAAVKRTYKRRR